VTVDAAQSSKFGRNLIMADASEMTYIGSYLPLTVLFFQYLQKALLWMDVAADDKLVFTPQCNRTYFHVYETSTGQYLFQSPTTGKYVAAKAGTNNYYVNTAVDQASAFRVDSLYVAARQVTVVGVQDEQDRYWCYAIDDENQNVVGYASPIPSGHGYGLSGVQVMPVPTKDAVLSHNEKFRIALIDWRYVVLGTFDLSGMQLVNVDFSNAQIVRGDLRNSTLTNVRFNYIDTVDNLLLDNPPQFTRVAKTGQPIPLSFVGAKLDIGILNGDWSYCNLSNATVVGTIPSISGLPANNSHLGALALGGAMLNNANFTQSNLTDNRGGADLSGSSAKRARFNGAVLHGVNFSHAIAQYADFSPDVNNQATDLTKATLANADLSNANLSNASMIGVNANRAILEAANLTGAQLGGQDGQLAAVLSYAYMPNAQLNGTNLYGVDFSFATFYGANASVAQTSSMELVRLSNAYLQGIDFSGSRLMGANFAGACLVNCTLIGADLSASNAGSVNATLTGACLQGVDFTGANLAGANLSGATVSFGNGSLQVQHFNSAGSLTSPQNVNYGPTIGLDGTTMTNTTICPNGQTLAWNLQYYDVSTWNQLTSDQKTQILTAPQPVTSWRPPA
jgi:uncharacterized protein YjbI with pentapeptide repeats